MSEYIVDTFGIVQDFADLHGDMNTSLYQAIMDVLLSRQHEEIVRCRDCAYKRNGWNGKRPTFSDWFFCAYCGGHELTNLNGFCAWGEKAVKDESDKD